HPGFQNALNWLITNYWRPVFYFLRRFGHSVHDAEDLTQEFFARFLAKNWVKPADSARGRFRNLLLTILNRFASKKTAKASGQSKFEKRLVSVGTLIEDRDRAYEPIARETPEEVFEKQWKTETLATARRNLEAHYRDKSDPLSYQIFAAYTFVDRTKEQPSQ